MPRRRIVTVTGIRSEYYLLKPVLKRMGEVSSGIESLVVVTGAHLSPRFGLTVREVEADQAPCGFHVAERIPSLMESDALSARAEAAGSQLKALASTVARLKPDFLLVLGDREEALTTAITGAYLAIPVAHISGGDRDTFIVDDSVRHAVTKLAHLHLAQTRENAERIIKMGEEPWRVHFVGSTGVEQVRHILQNPMPREKVSQALGFDLSSPPLALVIQHPVLTEVEDAGSQMALTLTALEELGKEVGLRAVMIYPNSDAGSQAMIAVIHQFADRLPSSFKVCVNLSHELFVNLLHQVDVLVGNSSCGLIEAPSIPLGAVNVGTRQAGRQHAENVLFVPYDKGKIKGAIRKALQDETFKKQVQTCLNPYEGPSPSEDIVRLLRETPMDQKLVVKRITY